VLKANPVTGQVAAISCGVYEGAAILDIDYAEDSNAEVDCNFVMAGDGRMIELQATGEKRPFTEEEFAEMMRLAKAGCRQLFDAQTRATG
jgi:ribonuclease PH